MITKDNLKALLACLGFVENNGAFKKQYSSGASIEVNFKTQKIFYNPLDNSFAEGCFPTKEKPAKGFVIHRDTTLNFEANENFVCLVCAHLLLEKGYEAKHMVFEPAFKVGHVNKPSYGDILVFDKEYKPLILIENKTYGAEFSKEWNNMQKNGGQLFSYLGPLVNDLGLCENLVLFAADFDEKEILKSHIITLRDNEKRIKELDHPKTFKDAQGKYFEVWDETYAKSFETKGLFERDIAAYSIGKMKYTIKDLKELSHAEIRPIYHEFATILRNHAITDFEHSFYILIDLFLCKITDERNNPNDLQFYYKGITRDTPKEYCARLLKLYQQGKHDIFNEEVVNKDENDIKQVFEDTNRSLTNGLYAGIKKLFEEIKFYNIKKFNFINVENKEEFELNFSILIKIAALIQDINLSSSETNHFFGDLFEGLLSKNVHQTEGQFFTPLPIVNFIINSLPEFSDSVKVLDYACGAGHFLTEFVKSYPNSKIYGIEKSPTLSQVAKIATIINGSKDSRVVFKDSLSSFNTMDVRFHGFDKESFDLIIANPPYSVKGFLNTLTDKDINQFELKDVIEEKAYGTNNKIECFFIELAKHFLRPNGLMGIVLPSSILSNTDKLFVKTRELIFANFNILAIANLNSRTFGSTGTNTIILFAQRVKKNSEGLRDTFIAKGDYSQYLSCHAIDSYIEMQGYNRDEYFEFMQNNELCSGLENNEIFLEYKKNFKSKPVGKSLKDEWFKTSSYFNENLKEKSKDYRNVFADFLQSSEYKALEEAEERRQFVAFAKEIESDKLNTFIQIDNNSVVILQSPSDKTGGKSNKTEVVKFLGYDWSNRKGDEGIKYITNRAQGDSDESTENIGNDEKDAEIVNAINSIKFIDTPLYNPNDAWDSSKFAFALRKHIYEQCRKFSFGENSINEKLNEDFKGEMSELLSYAKLSDLVDFSRSDFDKAIKTSMQKVSLYIESKYPLVKLKSVVEMNPSKDCLKNFPDETEISFVDMLSVSNNGFIENKINKKLSELRKGSYTYFAENDLIIAKITPCMENGKCALATDLTNGIALGSSEFHVFRCSKEILNSYLFAFLNRRIVREIAEKNMTGASGHRRVPETFYKEMQIPLPPLDVQKFVAAECEAVDIEYYNAEKEFVDAKAQITKIMESSLQNAKDVYKLSNNDIFDISIGRRILSSEISESCEIPVYSANVFEPFGKINKLLINDFSVPSVLWGIDGDWQVNVIAENQPFYPTDHCGVLRIKDNLFEPKYVAYVLKKEGEKEGFKRSYRASIDRIEAMSLRLPPLSEQRNIVKKINALEEKIATAKQILSEFQLRKQEILDKWLR